MFDAAHRWCWSWSRRGRSRACGSTTWTGCSTPPGTSGGCSGASRATATWWSRTSSAGTRTLREEWPVGGHDRVRVRRRGRGAVRRPAGVERLSGDGARGASSRGPAGARGGWPTSTSTSSRLGASGWCSTCCSPGRAERSPPSCTRWPGRPRRPRPHGGRAAPGAGRGHGVAARVPDVHDRPAGGRHRPRGWSSARCGRRCGGRPDELRRAVEFAGRVRDARHAARRPTDRVRDWVRFVVRWQRLTGPVTAKGVEDTALYRWDGLLSRSEVGGEPSRPAVAVAEFHRRMRERQRRWPGR